MSHLWMCDISYCVFALWREKKEYFSRGYFIKWGKQSNKMYILNTISSVSFINKNSSSIATDLYPSGPNRFPLSSKGLDLVHWTWEGHHLFFLVACLLSSGDTEAKAHATQLLFLSLSFFHSHVFFSTLSSEKVSTFVSVQNSRGPLSRHSLCFSVSLCLYKHHISRLCSLFSWHGKMCQRKSLAQTNMV